MSYAGAKAALQAERAQVQNFITEIEGAGIEAKFATELATFQTARNAFQPWQNRMNALEDHRQRLALLDALIAEAG